MTETSVDSTFDLAAVVAAVRSALPGVSEFAPLHTPVFRGNEWDYVKECIDTAWVSSVGKYVDRFEADLAEFTGVKRAVATANGTAALHIALELAGVGRDDEVLVPALTFVATANAVHYCRAVPHFIDSEERTLGVDPAKVDERLSAIGERRDGQLMNRETGRRIKALMCMHTFGHPVDLDPLKAVCEKHGIVLIEDAAEALGSYYHGSHVGGHGLFSALSFNGNKTITTGGGGALLTNDEALADRAKHLTTTAKLAHTWEYFHDAAGYNYRMPNINAALGCAQLEQLPRFLEIKRELYARYVAAFADVEGMAIVGEPEGCRSNYWLQTLRLEELAADRRDPLLNTLNEAGFGVRPCWTLLCRLPMYESCPRMDLTVAESLERRLINLPSGVQHGL